MTGLQYDEERRRNERERFFPGRPGGFLVVIVMSRLSETQKAMFKGSFASLACFGMNYCLAKSDVFIGINLLFSNKNRAFGDNKSSQNKLS